MKIKYCCFCGQNLEEVFKSTMLEDLYAFKCKCGSFVVRKSDEGLFDDNDKFTKIGQ